MTRERLGGWCLIAAAVMSLVTMAFHPSDATRPALGIAVHVLALFGVPLNLFGAWAVTRRLVQHGAVAELALAFQAMAAVAALGAATASGLIAPELVSAAPDADTMARFNYELNQAFAKVLVAASSVAIGIWSLQILRTRTFPRGIGVFGCVASVVALLTLFSGYLSMDVHGFGAVVLGQGVWLILIGLQMLQSAPAERQVA